MSETPLPAPNNAPVQRRTVGVLGASQVLTGIGVGAAIAAGSLLVAEMTGSENLAGLAQTFSVLGAAVAASPLALLSARAGRRIGLVTGLWIAAVGALTVLLGAYLDLVFVVFVGNFATGVATAVGLQARYAASDLAERAHVGRDLALVVWATTVGAVLGPNLMQSASELADLLSLPPLSGPYLVTSSALTLAALLVAGWLRPDPLLLAREQQSTVNSERVDSERVDSERVDSERVDSERVDSVAHRAMRAELRHGWAVVRRTPGATLAVGAIAVGHAVMVMVMVMTPVHMQHVDVTLQVVGLVISVHILGMYAFAPAVGWLADRRGARTVITAGVCLLAVSTLVAGTAPGDDVTQLGVGLFLLGLGWSGTLVGGSALLSTVVPVADRPSAQGLGDTVMNVAAATGGALAGVIVSTASYGWLNAAAAVALVPLAVGLVLSRPRRVDPPVRTPVR